MAGPFPDDEQNAAIQSFLEQGGRWLAFHGSSGGKAGRVLDDQGNTVAREMVKLPVHETLGIFFLNHPPHRAFTATNAAPGHALTRGLPDSFDVKDELYILEVLDPKAVPLVSTRLDFDAADSPPGFGFAYDPAMYPGRGEGKDELTLAQYRDVGAAGGGVVYIGMGHAHSPAVTANGSGAQPFVHSSIGDGSEPSIADDERWSKAYKPEDLQDFIATPPLFRGSWDHPAFVQLVQNALDWGCESEGAAATARL